MNDAGIDVVEIFPGVKVIGLTLYFESSDALVFGDLHLGFEEELKSMGFPVPCFQFKAAVDHLDRVFSGLGVDRVKSVVVDGDLKHEFSRISHQEWREVLSFIDYISDRCCDLVLVKGNHDTVVGPIASRKKIKLVDFLVLGGEGVYITHGHVVHESRELDDAGLVVVAHDHPAVCLRDGVRSEKVKCFLVGRWRGKRLIQIPSMFFGSEGCDVTVEGTLSPFIAEASDVLEAYCVEDFKVFYFGKLRKRDLF